MRSLGSTAPLVLAVVACALALGAMTRSPVPPPPHECAADELRSRIADLERQLASVRSATVPVLSGDLAIEAASTRSSAGRAPATPETPGGQPGTGGTETAAAGELAPGAAPAEAKNLTKSGRPKRGTPEHLQWARQRTLDASLTPAERADALGEIQRHGPDGYDPAVVHAMVALGQTAQDPEVRENIWRQFDGARDPVLASALLQALGNDTHGGVRREAAEALDHYRDDPAVRAALERAAQNDADEKVRWEALRALRRPKKQ